MAPASSKLLLVRDLGLSMNIKTTSCECPFSASVADATKETEAIASVIEPQGEFCAWFRLRLNERHSSGSASSENPDSAIACIANTCRANIFVFEIDVLCRRACVCHFSDTSKINIVD